MQHQTVQNHTPEKAILVGLSTSKDDKRKIDDYLDELAFLVETAGGKCIERFIQHLDSPNPSTFVGTGNSMK